MDALIRIIKLYGQQITALERKQSRLTARLEDQEHENRELRQRLEKMENEMHTLKNPKKRIAPALPLKSKQQQP